MFCSFNVEDPHLYFSFHFLHLHIARHFFLKFCCLSCVNVSLSNNKHLSCPSTPSLSCVQSIPFFGGIEIILFAGRCRYTFSHFQARNSYLADWLAMADTVSFILFMLLFGNIRSESMSSCFSCYENRALNTKSTFMRSIHVKDVLLCARACGAESNCNTANYNSEDNTCQLFKKQISPEAAMMTARGYHLITNVGLLTFV